MLDSVEVVGVSEISLDDVISKKRVYVSKDLAESNPLLFRLAHIVIIIHK